MVIFLIALLGVFVTFTYAVNYNAGNNSRAQALAILQREVELFRSAKFTPNTTDSYTPVSTVPDDGRRDLTGGVKPTRVVKAADGNRFRVMVVVDDDPFTPNAPNSPQIDATNKSVTMKELSISVTLDSPTPGWQTSVPATVVLRRVRAN
jgi:type II secretory pathway pseudopilin PulG